MSNSPKNISLANKITSVGLSFFLYPIGFLSAMAFYYTLGLILSPILFSLHLYGQYKMRRAEGQSVTSSLLKTLFISPFELLYNLTVITLGVSIGAVLMFIVGPITAVRDGFDAIRNLSFVDKFNLIFFGKDRREKLSLTKVQSLRSDLTNYIAELGKRAKTDKRDQLVLDAQTSLNNLNIHNPTGFFRKLLLKLTELGFYAIQPSRSSATYHLNILEGHFINSDTTKEILAQPDEPAQESKERETNDSPVKSFLIETMRQLKTPDWLLSKIEIKTLYDYSQSYPGDSELRNTLNQYFKFQYLIKTDKPNITPDLFTQYVCTEDMSKTLCHSSIGNDISTFRVRLKDEAHIEHHLRCFTKDTKLDNVNFWERCSELVISYAKQALNKENLEISDFKVNNDNTQLSVNEVFKVSKGSCPCILPHIKEATESLKIKLDEIKQAKLSKFGNKDVRPSLLKELLGNTINLANVQQQSSKSYGNRQAL